jgi:hypothetical protein
LWRILKVKIRGGEPEFRCMAQFVQKAGVGRGEGVLGKLSGSDPGQALA